MLGTKMLKEPAKRRCTGRLEVQYRMHFAANRQNTHKTNNSNITNDTHVVLEVVQNTVRNALCQNKAL